MGNLVRCAPSRLPEGFPCGCPDGGLTVVARIDRRRGDPSG